MDGHGGQPQPGGDRHAAHPEDERAGQVDEFGAVPGERGGEPPAGKGHADLRVAGQGQRGNPDHGAGVVGGRGAGGCRRPGGGDDERPVATGGEVPGGLQGAVGHAVDVGREGFGDDDDTHTGVVTAWGVSLPTWICPPGELT